jgi:hypothetical protein
MKRPKRPYSVQKRPTVKKSRKIYYVKFRDPETGLYMSAVSSGKTNRSDACNWADDQLRTGAFNQVRIEITFAEYAKDFWNYQVSPYIRGRLARGLQFSRTQAKTAEGYVRNHIIPFFGKMKLREITGKRIERWVLDQYEAGKVSPTSINKHLSVFRVMMREAFMNGLLASDPTVRVREVAERPVERGILKPDEVRALLDPARAWVGTLGRWYPEYAIVDFDDVHLEDVEATRKSFGFTDANSFLCRSPSANSYHLLFRPQYREKAPTCVFR